MHKDFHGHAMSSQCCHELVNLGRSTDYGEGTLTSSLAEGAVKADVVLCLVEGWKAIYNWNYK